MLARLATETGGRITNNTNDLSLGFARAQRDLGCQYTLGFYLSDEIQDTPRNVAVRMHRDGLRALHPDKYLLRSDSAKRESDTSAAFFAPGLFQSGYVNAHIFTLQPKTKQHWETLLAVSFPVKFDETSPESTIDFGAVLHQDRQVKHVFNRRVTLRQQAGAGNSERRFMFLEPIDIKPGSYELIVVMTDVAGGNRPEALRTNLDVPEITARELMLVKPILGRPRDENIVVRGDGPSNGRTKIASEELALHDIVATRGSFEPMLVQRLENVDEVLSRNKACLVARKTSPAASIERIVTPEDDAEPFSLPSVPLALAMEGKKVLCQNVFEVLPEEKIDDGRYLLEATIDQTPTRSTVRDSLRFAVTDVPDD